MKNSVNLLGHIGANPEVKQIKKDVKLASIQMATSYSFRDKKGEIQTKTQWHELKLWAHLATTAEKYLAKGDLIDIEGMIEYEHFEDKNGSKHVKAIIRVERLLIVRSKAKAEKASK